jgi:hypothetical protein
MTPDLSDDKAILATLDPPAPRLELIPPPKPPGERWVPRVGGRGRGGRLSAWQRKAVFAVDMADGQKEAEGGEVSIVVP